MLIRLPSSRASLRLCLSPADAALAAVSPFAALYLRNVGLASSGEWIAAASYSLVSLGFSLVCFQVCRISETIPRYITVGDLLNLAKAVLGGQLMTTIALFTVTRLDGIPRSVPAIQALILASGLLAYRGLTILIERRRQIVDQPKDAVSENVILIGLNDWSVLVLKFLKAQASVRWRVIALLDDRPRWTGCSVGGVRVLGPPSHLDAVIEEFAMHGVRTDRVAVGSAAGELSEAALAQVKAVCAQRNLDFVVVPDLLGLGSAPVAHSAEDNPDHLPSRHVLPDIPASPYLRCKRLVDACAAALLLLWLLPLLAIAAFLVLLDVGSPVLFWQQRIGRGGRELQIYKLRTLRPPFDRKGERIPDEQRLSWIGRRLRQTRIDELPQLLNVLVGDMSLIGPRPLLPQDQPPNAATRLSICPGITGWAQVNGGASLTPSEKRALDVWYIRNASPLLDLRIIGMTLLCLLKGDRRSEKALAQARAPHLRLLPLGPDKESLRSAVSSRLTPAVDRPPGDDARDAVAVQSG